MFYSGLKLITEASFSKFAKLNDFDMRQYDDNYLLKMEQMFLLFLSRFQYDNLPESMQLTMGQRNYIDAMLFFQPSIAFFEDSKLGVQALPTTGEYKFNIVGRPVEWTARSFTGKSWNLNNKNSVIMYNDEAMSIPFLQLDYYVKIMVEAEKTLRQNLQAQRQPYVVECEEESLKSAKTLWNEVDEFKPIIFKRKQPKNQTPIELKVMQTGVPLIAKDMDDIVVTYLNKALTYLGINNINVQDKKERLITSEASANDMLIQTYYTSQARQRERAIEEVNKMFGTNIVPKPVDLTSMVTAIQNEYSAGIVSAENKNNYNQRREADDRE